VGTPARRTVFQDCTESETKDSLEGFEWEFKKPRMSMEIRKYYNPKKTLL